MRWTHFKELFLKFNFKEGELDLIYFDSCSPARSNFIFGVKMIFSSECIEMSWHEKYKDLAIEILVSEFSEDFDKIDYIIFNDKKIFKLTDLVVEEVLASNICNCTLHADSAVLYKSSMWTRYLRDPAFPLDNLFDELARQSK